MRVWLRRSQTSGNSYTPTGKLWGIVCSLITFGVRIALRLCLLLRTTEKAAREVSLLPLLTVNSDGLRAYACIFPMLSDILTTFY